MKNWENRALALLETSLHPRPCELNEMDWKSDISDNSERVAQHISAFSNLAGGGFFTFGVDNSGTICGLSTEQINQIVHRIGQIARNNLSDSIFIDHSVHDFNGKSVLFIYVAEATSKPIFLRGKTVWDSYRRSAAHTVKMSQSEVKQLLALSQGHTFEEQIASTGLPIAEIIRQLDFESYYRMLDRALPGEIGKIVEGLADDGIVIQGDDTYWSITNLGAILFARNIPGFKNLARKAVRVIQYSGNNKIQAIHEIDGKKGYASGFEGLITYIMGLLPANEVIESALRKEYKMYPEIAIREFVANALIHQDFAETGVSVMIEIYSDRIEITNPGVPLVDVYRFIDTPPKSRNEKMASLLRRLKICEERGSGVDRAVEAIEAFQLPAPKFERGADYTKVTMYAHMQLTKMDKENRIRACYQHCCLLYVSNRNMTNQAVRERFLIPESNYPMASRIIAETLEAGLIKNKDAESTSRKHAAYVPFWA